MGDRIDCRQATEQLHDYLKQEITPELAEEIRAHLERCKPCFNHARFEESFLRHAGELRPPALPRHAAGPDRRPPAGRGGAGLSPPWPTAALVAAAVAALAWGLRTLTGGRRARRLAGGHARSSRAPAGPAARCWPPFSSPAASSPASSRPIAASTPRASRRDAAPGARPTAAPAALAALLGLARPELALWLVTGSLAAAAADTWATSLGRRSRTAPRDLLGGRAVPPGTSGGVTVARDRARPWSARRWWPGSGRPPADSRCSSRSRRW